MRDRHAEDWEELARREPYFAVLTHESSLGVAGNSTVSAAFFETGEADIASLLSTIASVIGGEVSLGATLDFGCGVGRLTLPLARRASRVMACDVAPTMLVHARDNARNAGLENVAFILSDELMEVPGGQFDFVCSLLVLQHIPPSMGMPIIRNLLRLLAPGGIAALHFTFERPGGRLRRMARMVRGRSRFVHRLIGTLQRDPHRLPYMQMNDYDLRVVLGEIEAAGAKAVARLPTHRGDTSGAVLVIRK